LISTRRLPGAARQHSEERADACLKALHALGYEHAAAIGRVLEQGEALEPIVLRLD